MNTTEVMRIITVLLGGLTVGISIPVCRLYLRRAVRLEALAIKLFLGIHISIVLYISGVIADRAGEPLSWYTPAAGAIFLVKAIVLLMLREACLAREHRIDQPTRRGGDDAR